MNTKPIDQLNEIRDMMERSSRFISLSGLSGIIAGILALAGAAFAFFYLNYDLRYFNPDEYFNSELPWISYSTIGILFADAALVLSLAIGAAVYFTTRKAKKQGLKIWSISTKQLLISLFIPLATGGIFCFILLYHRLIFLIAPATLIFYGLALLNASKYTLGEIKWLGILEITLGLLAAIFAGYGLLVWAIGFGILHILYGVIMYNRYERNL